MVESSTYSKILKLCFMTLIFCFILKIFGSEVFYNPIFEVKQNYEIKHYLLNAFMYSLNVILFISIVNKKFFSFKINVVVFILSIVLNYILFNYVNHNFKSIIEIIYLFVLSLLLTKGTIKQKLIEVIFVSIILNIIQLISLITRSVDISMIPYNNLTAFIILNVDYYIMIFIIYLNSSKDGRCNYVRFIIFLSNIGKFKISVSQVQKIDGIEDNEMFWFILFTILVTVFQALMIFTVSYFIHNTILNTLIICISFFYLRKHFGDSFHSDNIITCTFTSIVVFVCCTKLSFPLNVSMLSCNLIGITLSYFMYHLYCYNEMLRLSNKVIISRGMSKEEMTKLCKLNNVNDLKTKIMIGFYCEGMSLPQLSVKYDKSVATISNYKKQTLNKIKGSL